MKSDFMNELVKTHSIFIHNLFYLYFGLKKLLRNSYFK
jgi:hypothetical protein